MEIIRSLLPFSSTILINLSLGKETNQEDIDPTALLNRFDSTPETLSRGLFFQQGRIQLPFSKGQFLVLYTPIV